MSIMASLDIVLTEEKLSEPQKNAIVDLLSGGTNAKPNTIKSLVKKGLILEADGSVVFEPDFYERIQAAIRVPEARSDEELKESRALAMVTPTDTQEDFVLNDQKSVAEAIYGDPQEIHESVDKTYLDISPETFNADWVQWEIELMGFEAVLPWRKREVWHGLTAQEIADDIKTARPAGRKGRRAQARLNRTLARVA